MALEIRRIMLFVNDIETMTRFYEKSLGLEVLTRDDGFVDFDAGACRLALHSLAESYRPAPPRSASTLRTSLPRDPSLLPGA